MSSDKPLTKLDQPNPITGFGDMWERIMDRFALIIPPGLKHLMVERRLVGIERYGTPLQAYNGRNALLDLVAEKLDALVYAEQVALERPQLTSKMLEMQRKDLEDIMVLMSSINLNK